MSDIFNRLGRLARSVISDFTKDTDADYDAAWSELNDFLGTEGRDTSTSSASSNRQSSDYSSGSRQTHSNPLARDYANLETSPNADLETLKTNYKKLLRKYHPDRFADDAEKSAIATTLTARLNESYDRIIKSRS